jgi:hypothetical protein
MSPFMFIIIRLSNSSEQIIKDLVTLFPVIRDWIVEFLDDNKDMTASMVGRNMLIEQVDGYFLSIYSLSK